MAYRLTWPPKLDRVRNVFHISMLRKYLPDPSHVLDISVTELQGDLRFDETLVRIMAREDKKLRNQIVPM